jgi:hypothetical protein
LHLRGILLSSKNFELGMHFDTPLWKPINVNKETGSSIDYFAFGLNFEPKINFFDRFYLSLNLPISLAMINFSHHNSSFYDNFTSGELTLFLEPNLKARYKIFADYNFFAGALAGYRTTLINDEEDSKGYSKMKGLRGFFAGISLTYEF